MAKFRTLRFFAPACVVALLSVCVGTAGPISFDTFVHLTGTSAQSVVDGFPSGLTGVGYLGNGNFIVGMQGAGPISTLLFTSNGTTLAPFGPSNKSFLGTDPKGGTGGEHRLAIGSGLGGFPSGDVYVADASTIYHLDTHGSILGTVSLPGIGAAPPEIVRNMVFDSTGAFGNKMLVSSDVGNIYTVDSAGNVVHLATLPAAPQPRDPAHPHDVEAMDIAPQGVFGPFQGQLIVALHDGGTGPQDAPNGLYAIAPNGNVTQLPIAGSTGVFDAESLLFVPNFRGSSSDGYYVTLYPFQVMRTGPTALDTLSGDAVVFSESPAGAPVLYRLHWNGSSFDAPALINVKLPSVVTEDPPCPNSMCAANLGLTEQAIFVAPSAAIPEPGTGLLCGVFLLAGVLLRVRRGRQAA